MLRIRTRQGQPLNGPGVQDRYGTVFNSESISESFDDYLIYRPTGGIWVTLGKMTWSWSASVAYREATQDYSLTAPIVSATAITGSASDVLPTWSDLGPNVKELKKQN